MENNIKKDEEKRKVEPAKKKQLTNTVKKSMDIADFMSKIENAMTNSRQQQTKIDEEEKLLREETRIIMVEERKAKVEELKEFKTEFDEMTSNSLVRASKEIKKQREKIKSDCQEKVNIQLKKIETIRRRVEISEKNGLLNAQKEEIANNGIKKAYEEINSILKDQKEKNTKFDEYEEIIYAYAIEIGCENKVAKQLTKYTKFIGDDDKGKSANEEVKNEEVKNNEVKNEEVKNEEVKNNEVKNNEVKNEEVKNEEVKNNEVKNEEVKNNEVKNEEVKNNEVKNNEVKNEEVKNEEVKNNKGDYFFFTNEDSEKSNDEQENDSDSKKPLEIIIGNKVTYNNGKTKGSEKIGKMLNYKNRENNEESTLEKKLKDVFGFGNLDILYIEFARGKYTEVENENANIFEVIEEKINPTVINVIEKFYKNGDLTQEDAKEAIIALINKDKATLNKYLTIKYDLEKLSGHATWPWFRKESDRIAQFAENNQDIAEVSGEYEPSLFKRLMKRIFTKTLKQGSPEEENDNPFIEDEKETNLNMDPNRGFRAKQRVVKNTESNEDKGEYVDPLDPLGLGLNEDIIIDDDDDRGVI